ncbi:peptide chain release factor N(5)-glutamine methyltransferase [Candidatus Kapaibacterium sp.]
MKEIWKVIDVIEWGKDYFDSKGIDSPRLNIELIISKVLNKSRIQLYTGYDLPLNKDELASIKEYIIRRVKREPLQYILGQTSFFDFNINLNHYVLIPRPETEELVDLIITDNDTSDNLEILDIGTGSGCISIALARKFHNSKITAIDISEDALKLAKENSSINNVGSRIEFINIDIINQIVDKKFDLIVSNPPYIPGTVYSNELAPELSYEPKIALTDNNDGISFYRRYSQIFYNLLLPDGKFYFEFGFGQENIIRNLFENKYNIEFLKDFQGILRMAKGNVKN